MSKLYSLEPYGEIGETVDLRKFGRGPVVLSYETRTHGWRWAVEPDDGPQRHYRTNREGEGLWAWSHSRSEWQQTLGTCQFSLPSNRKNAHARIMRRFVQVDD